MSDLDDILRVGTDDILYKLREEKRVRADAIRAWRANACYGSIREDDHIHTLVSEAAAEIIRLRMELNRANAT
jgi:hypothetical protein